MELTVQKREIFGKKNRFLRKDGFIPAELYGHGFENIHFSVPAKDFLRVFKEAGESTIIELKVGEGKEKLSVLVHDVSRNPLTRDIEHVDFYRLRMDEKIKTAIPLEFIGEAPAVKEFGGILVKAMQEIEIEALPADLPRNIEVPLSGLKEIGASIYVRDLKVPDRVKIFVDSETVIATVTEPVKEEVAETPVPVEGAAVQAGEAVIGEKKGEESERHEAKSREKKSEAK